MSYGTLPAAASAAISPTSVSLSAGGSGSATLTLNTLQKVSSAGSSRPLSRDVSGVLAAAALLLLPLGAVRRKTFARLLGLLLFTFSLQMLTGCTNSWYIAKTVAPGTYKLDVTATDINHNSQTATLTVVIPN